MKRREFIALLGGAAAWPLAARAQQARVWRIGYLGMGALQNSPFIEAIQEGLRALGYVEGQNLVLDMRSAEGNLERLPALMQELIAARPDVITVATSSVVTVAKRATSTIPIVMLAVTDPVGSGVVDSLARPGGNVTGISHMSLDVTAKALEILREIMPNLQRIGILMSLNPAHPAQLREAQTAANLIGVTVVPVTVRNPQEMDKAFAAAEQEKCQAMIVLADGFYTPVVQHANKARLPCLYQLSQYVKVGGLISFGADFPALFRRGAYFVDRILKGAEPKDLPVERPTKFELLINLKTAKSLGIDIPPTLLARADEVIE
jgi:putative ABC transport system substrate-binding protein